MNAIAIESWHTHARVHTYHTRTDKNNWLGLVTKLSRYLVSPIAPPTRAIVEAVLDDEACRIRSAVGVQIQVEQHRESLMDLNASIVLWSCATFVTLNLPVCPFLAATSSTDRE